MTKNKCLPLDRFSAFIETNSKLYYSQYNISLIDSLINVGFHFNNNPYCFDSSYKILYFINNQLVHKGEFLENGKIQIPKKYFKECLIHFSIEIISPKHDNKIFIFQNKDSLHFESPNCKLEINFSTSAKDVEKINFRLIQI